MPPVDKRLTELEDWRREVESGQFAPFIQSLVDQFRGHETRIQRLEDQVKAQADRTEVRLSRRQKLAFLVTTMGTLLAAAIAISNLIARLN